MKDIRKIKITLTNPLGQTRVVTAVSMNPAQTNPNFTHSDPDMNGDVVTIQAGATNTSYEIVVRTGTGNFKFLNDFVDACMTTSLTGTGLFKNTSVAGKPEIHILTGVTVVQKESGQHDNSNVDATFTILAESVTRTVE